MVRGCIGKANLFQLLGVSLFASPIASSVGKLKCAPRWIKLARIT